MDGCLDEMAAHFSANLRTDERGVYVAGFYSDALRNRAGAKNEPGVWSWYETQAALLIFRVLIADRDGARQVAKAFDADRWFGGEELLRRAKKLAREDWPGGVYA